MNDTQLRDLLDRAVPESHPRGPEFRLRQGQAVRRRHRLVGVGAGAAAALVLGGGIAVVASTWSPDNNAQPASGGSAVASASPSISPTAAEDATTATPAPAETPPQTPEPQPTHFPKSKMSFAMPDGWEVHRADPSVAVSLNKIGEPVSDEDGWLGELVVMASEPQWALGESNDTVTYNGRVFSFRDGGGDHGTLTVESLADGPAAEVQLQYPVDIDLSRDQLIALADSVTLDDDAILGKG